MYSLVWEVMWPVVDSWYACREMMMERAIKLRTRAAQMKWFEEDMMIKCFVSF